jgi:hypothetical protein
VINAVATWPSARHPTVALDMRDATAGAWIPPLLPLRARALGLHPRAWQSARARALVVSHGQPALVSAAEAVIGRKLAGPRVSLYSSSACAGKVTCFISESGKATPTVVVKAMADPRDAWWLREEVRKLGAVRARLSSELKDALLPEPLFAGELNDEYVVVEAFCSLENWGDRSVAARARAHAWLRDFHRCTNRGVALWHRSDTIAAMASVGAAWSLVRPRVAQTIMGACESRLSQLEGCQLPRCAVHGDFSAGNLAFAHGRLKVLDWEWADLDGTPHFDLWCYELAELHRRMGKLGPREAEGLLRDSLDLVEAQLASAGVEPDFALATLPVVLSELVVRVRRTLGTAGLWELRGGDLMAAVERLVIRSGAAAAGRDLAAGNGSPQPSRPAA